MPLTTGEPPRDDLVAMLREMQRRLDQLERKSSLANTGLTALGPGSVQVDGAIQSANYVAGTSGWRGDGTGFEFNPPSGNTGRVSTTNFAMTTTMTTVASTTFTVPSGFTKCQATVFGQVYAINSNATGGSNGTGGDAWYARAILNGQYTPALPTGVSGSGGYALTTTGDAFTLTGLTPGGTVTLSIQAGSAFQSSIADAKNVAYATASLLWSH